MPGVNAASFAAPGHFVRDKAAVSTDVTVCIGGLGIRLRCGDAEFAERIRERYTGYVSDSEDAAFDFAIELAAPGPITSEAGVHVGWDAGRWIMKRGDFRAEWNPATGLGRISQMRSPFGLDSVLRIVHTLLLAQRGGFLMHASSAIRNGRAFLFAGVSGAGKTTIARLAPPDAILLTDEISYVVPRAGGYVGMGTPFYGELARPGENQSAPVAAVYLLTKGPANRIEAVRPSDAVRGLLANILFFARDPEFVKRVFDAACEFAERVPVCRLTFAPDARVWEMIQ